MSNEELLVAIKGIVEEVLEEKLEEVLEEKLEEKLERKFDEKLAPINQKIDKMEQEITCLRLDNENVIKLQLRLLAENYVPAAKLYEKSVDEMEQVKFDVDTLKNVVAKHSEILQKIS